MLSNLTIVNSVFEGNQATAGDGGAVYTDGGYVPYHGKNGANDGRVSLCGCRFTGNSATASAGAAFLYMYKDEASGKADTLAIRRTEFSGNRVTTASPGLGGAIRIDAVALIQETLFAENDCAGQGGALWMGRGPATFENVTFYANHAALWGGAISYSAQPIVLNHCTVAKNTADAGSDGLFGGPESTPQVSNSLFYANGKSGTGRHCRRPIAATATLVYPAEANDTCGPDLIHQDPLLAADLKDNGGFTRTVALLPGSPALGAGSSCPALDQRGQPRNPDPCDLGAFELP